MCVRLQVSSLVLSTGSLLGIPEAQDKCPRSISDAPACLSVQGTSSRDVMFSEQHIIGVVLQPSDDLPVGIIKCEMRNGGSLHKTFMVGMSRELVPWTKGRALRLLLEPVEF